MTVIPPQDVQITAIECHCDRAVRQVSPSGGNSNGTRSGSAGLGNAHTALPYAHSDMGSVQDVHNLNIGVLWKQRMGFDGGAKLRQVNIVRVIDEKHHVGVAHVHGDRVRERADHEIKMGRVFLHSEGDVLPVELCRSHVNGDQIIFCSRRSGWSGQCF